MSLRERNGKWHYRFYKDGRTYTADTGLAATKRNQTNALMVEAEARKQVGDGLAEQLKIKVKPFSDAADQFVEFSRSEKQGKWKRTRGSMTGLKVFFGLRPLHAITTGEILNFMAWRRGCPTCSGSGCDLCDQTGDGVKEITLLHDIHALSLLFKYGTAHHWCRVNLATSENLKAHGSRMPSDKDAVRIHVLTLAEERAYFTGCLMPPERIKIASKPHTQVRNGRRISIAAYEYSKICDRELRDLHDIARLMLLQGPRPSEVMATRVENVDLERGMWTIPKSKSLAGRRTLRLTAEARSIFAARIAAAPPSGWLFAGKKSGTHLTDVENSHKTVLAATGLRFVLYDLRHTFATRFYEATRDLEALRKVLGHSNLRTIQKYVHVSQEHVDSAMAVFEEALRVKSGSNTRAEVGQLATTKANDGVAGTDSIQ